MRSSRRRSGAVRPRTRLEALRDRFVAGDLEVDDFERGVARLLEEGAADEPETAFRVDWEDAAAFARRAYAAWEERLAEKDARRARIAARYR